MCGGFFFEKGKTTMNFFSQKGEYSMEIFFFKKGENPVPCIDRDMLH
jgi:hypothetical protein